MPASSAYHVILDGQGYLIDPGSYRRKPATAFAAKLQFGDTTYASLVGSSAWAQSEWIDGVFEGSQEYDRTKKQQRAADAASVDISFGDVRLGRPLTSVFSTEPIAALATFAGALYAAAKNSGKVYTSTDGTTWALAQDLALVTPTTPTVTGLAALVGTGTALYVGAANNGKVFRFDGTSWVVWRDGSGSGTGEFPQAVTALAQVRLPNGTGWYPSTAYTVIAIAYALVNTPAAGAASDYGALALLDESAAPDATLLGPVTLRSSYPQIPVLATGHDSIFFGPADTRNGVQGEALSWNGVPFGGGPGGGGSARSIAVRDDNALASLNRFRGSAYAGSMIQGKVWQLTNDDLTTFFVLPQLAMGGAPPSYTKPVRTLAVADDRFYAAFNDTQGLSLWQFDGTGWVRYAVGPAAADPYAMASFNGAIIVAAGPGLYRAPQTYAPSGWLKTPWFDADLASIDKALAHLTLTFAPLTTGQQVAAAYAVDDGTAFTALGTANTVGQQSATFAFPTGAHGKRVQLRYTLSSSVPTTTPKLRSTVLEYQLITTGADGLPGVRNEYVFDPLLEGTRELPLMRLDRSEEPLTGAQLRQVLWTSKGKPSTIAFTDTDGTTHTVWFADLEDHLIREREVATRQGWRGSVRLVEA
jgi:hypothetical protein